MADLYPFKDVPGLLAPEQQGNVRSNALLNAAAALLKSGAYSPVPVSPWSQIGQGVEGLLAGNRQGGEDALKQEVLRGQIDDRKLKVLQAIAQYQGAGLPVPELLHKMLGPNAATGGIPAPAAPAVPGGPAPTTLVGSNPQIPASPGLPPSLFSPEPMATTPPPQSPVATPAPAPAAGAAPAPMPAGVTGLIRQLPTTDRYALVGGGSTGKIVERVTAKNAEVTPDQKNAAASGKSSPFSYIVDSKNSELTPEVKTARDAGFKTVPEYVAHLEAVKAQGGAKGKRIADIIDAGGSHARNTLNTLNVMEDALTRGGDKVFTGPFAEEALKVKQAAKNMGFNVEGVPESEILGKLNAFLAGEATKQISSRPAQFEFQTYLKNNPGLLTSAEGTKKLINIMRQTTHQNINLSKLALNDANVAKWGDVEDQFYNDPKNAIVSPFTGKAFGNAQEQAPAVQTATNPKTGQKLKLENGKWVPLQ